MTPIPTDKLDAATTVAVNGPEDAMSVRVVVSAESRLGVPTTSLRNPTLSVSRRPVSRCGTPRWRRFHAPIPFVSRCSVSRCGLNPSSVRNSGSGEVTISGRREGATCSTARRANAISKRARRSRPSRRPAGVDTERAQNLSSASISATQRQPRGSRYTSHDCTLSEPRDLYVTDVPRRRLTLSVGFRRLVVGTPC